MDPVFADPGTGAVPVRCGRLPFLGAWFNSAVLKIWTEALLASRYGIAVPCTQYFKLLPVFAAGVHAGGQHEKPLLRSSVPFFAFRWLLFWNVTVFMGIGHVFLRFELRGFSSGFLVSDGSRGLLFAMFLKKSVEVLPVRSCILSL